MIKAAGTRNGKTMFLFGFSEDNIRLLKEGKPIVIDLTEMGTPGEVIIIYGETMGHLMATLQEAGLLPPCGGPN